jgi:hypothetical protein
MAESPWWRPLFPPIFKLLVVVLHLMRVFFNLGASWFPLNGLVKVGIKQDENMSTLSTSLKSEYVNAYEASEPTH